MSAPRCRICDEVLSTTTHPPSGQEWDCPETDNRPEEGERGEQVCPYDEMQCDWPACVNRESVKYDPRCVGRPDPSTSEGEDV